MSARNEAATATSSPSQLNEESVREYLKDNSDFLQRHPELLDHLHISHASGSAISLVEKQVSVLRERNIDMRHRLKTLTGNARENDKLYELTRKLVLQLLEAGSIDALHRAFIAGMKNDFGVEHASLILFDTLFDYHFADHFDNLPGSSSDHPPENAAVPVGCRCVSPDDARAHIGALLRGNKPVCGALRKEELHYLFPAAGAVGSAALMPLTRDGELGLIAVGNSDAGRYNSAMGTLFLSHIADVIVRLLPRLASNTA